ncbi:hypothetical protein B0J17DRAFT_723455 [Rhizoctonia solani]|nr:hypothetical protein B0J17DRAFT_723455 [Rhizoctonia solani]
MGKPNQVVHSPSVAWTMRSAVTALLSFVALQAIPLSSTLDTLIESVKVIVDVSHTSRRQELMDFGEHVGRVVNQLVSALRNERLSQQPSARRALEELQRRAVFPEEDQMEVVRMRQQLEDALSLFQASLSWPSGDEFTAVCQLLARLRNPSHEQPVDTSAPTQRSIQSHSGAPDDGRSHYLERAAPPTPESTWVGTVSTNQNQVHQRDPLQRNRRTRPNDTAFIEAAPPILDNAELVAAYREVDSLRRSFRRCRRPLPAMELAIALGRYSDLLVKSGHATEALAASQESANLFKSLAEKGPQIYYDFD